MVADTFEAEVSARAHSECEDAEAFCSRIDGAFSRSAEKVLSKRATTRHKPWISNTLSLIKRHRCARAAGVVEKETKLSREVKRAARNDKRAWLLDLARSGPSAAARHLRSG